MGMLRLMQAGCGTWIRVILVASDKLSWRLGDSVCPSLTQRTCNYKMRVLGDSDRDRVNQAPYSESPFPRLRHPQASCCSLSLRFPWALKSQSASWKAPPVGMGFSPLSLGTFVLTLGSSVNFHIHQLSSHHHHNVRNDLMLAGDNTEQLGEEVDRDLKRAGWCLLTPSPILLDTGIFSY